MGQKVNPIGMRVGINKDWDATWFASKKDFADNLVEGVQIRNQYLHRQAWYDYWNKRRRYRSS